MTPNEMTIADLFEYGGRITVTVGLLVILVGGKWKWWRWGYQFEELRADTTERLNEAKAREAEAKAETAEWKAIALRNLDVAQTQSKALLPTR
jgi:hypothetical protein